MRAIQATGVRFGTPAFFIASIVATNGAATTIPENTARSPMESSSKNVGRCETCSAANSALDAATRASIFADRARASSFAPSIPPAAAAMAAARSGGMRLPVSLPSVQPQSEASTRPSPSSSRVPSSGPVLW